MGIKNVFINFRRIGWWLISSIDRGNSSKTRENWFVSNLPSVFGWLEDRIWLLAPRFSVSARVNNQLNARERWKMFQNIFCFRGRRLYTNRSGQYRLATRINSNLNRFYVSRKLNLNDAAIYDVNCGLFIAPDLIGEIQLIALDVSFSRQLSRCQCPRHCNWFPRNLLTCSIACNTRGLDQLDLCTMAGFPINGIELFLKLEKF